MRQPSATATGIRNGQPGHRLPVFVCLLRFLRHGLLFSAFLTAWPAAAEQDIDTGSLNELARLARAGAPQLALRRMDAEQPAPADDVVAWSVWERERLQILANQSLYEALVTRVSRIPAQADPSFRQFALALQADARLQLGEMEAARHTLRDLLWAADAASVAPATRAHWRQLVIRSYVLEDRVQDARMALQRYRQDFGDDDVQWRWLSAQVMIQSGHADGVQPLLENDKDAHSAFLRYSAQLRLQPGKAGELATTVATLAPAVDSPQLQGALWALAAQAADTAGQRLEQITYLEHALSLPTDEQLLHGVLELDADQLWNAYLEQGRQIGNQEQKLLGNDEEWYFPATRAIEKDPLRARVLFSVLTEYGTSPERKALANDYLVSLLQDLPNGDRLIRRLYLESDRYADVATLPAVIRYRLIDEALQGGDLKTASRLMAGLSQPPAGSDRLDWDLRRARVAIYTGDIDGGVRLLQQLLETQQDWSTERVDRLLQVIFDLQTVKAHDQALQLLTSLLQKPLDAPQQREILFWMADSLSALERHDEAAYLYIKSATFGDPTAMDQWAQTARYRAAKELVDAGLLDDARQIYGLLLRSSNDASRKAVLQNELQRLYLLSGTRGE